MINFLAQATSKGTQGSGGWPLILLFGLMFVIMYFLILRPQRKKERDRKDMLSRVKKNDRVVTAGGIHGVVISVKENELLVRVDDAKDVKLRIDKSAISTIIESKDEEEEEK
ncbi:MAG: preprotein translocase subunit YajC [Planctomycetes bacterium]|nr:preprotein translocase subunit YajC [Planctomycetota bacterium]